MMGVVTMTRIMASVAVLAVALPFSALAGESGQGVPMSIGRLAQIYQYPSEKEKVKEKVEDKVEAEKEKVKEKIDEATQKAEKLEKPEPVLEKKTDVWQPIPDKKVDIEKYQILKDKELKEKQDLLDSIKAKKLELDQLQAARDKALKAEELEAVQKKKQELEKLEATKVKAEKLDEVKAKEEKLEILKAIKEKQMLEAMSKPDALTAAREKEAAVEMKRRINENAATRKAEELKSAAGDLADVAGYFGLSAEDAAVLAQAAKKTGMGPEAAAKLLAAAEGSMDKALALLGASAVGVKQAAEAELKLAEAKRAKEHALEEMKAALKGEAAVGADEEEKAGLLDELKAVYQKLEAAPGDGRLLEKAARINYLLGRTDEAKELAQVAAEKYDDKVPSLSLLALIAKKTGDSTEALARLDEAIQAAKAAGKDAAELRALAGTLRAEQGDLKKAQDDLEEGLQADKKNPDLIAKLKEVYKKTGAPGLKVFVEGKKQQFDVAPQVVAGRTLVPLRAIAESLNAKVDWDEKTRTVTFAKGTIKVQLTLDVKVALVNGVQTTLDVPPVVINGRTLVPLRFLSESMKAKVSYDGDTGMITVDSEEAPPDATTTPAAPAPAVSPLAPTNP